MNCLIILPGEIRDDGLAVVTGGKVRHIRDVLKKSAGDTLVAGVLNGPLGVVRIVSMSNHEVVLDVPRGEIPPVPCVDLILAMPRPKVMKRLWAPLASLGAGEIMIVGAQRVEPFYFSSHALDEDIYRPRLIEGLEQARDTRMPEVSIHRSFAQFARDRLPHFCATSECLIAHPGAPVWNPLARARGCSAEEGGVDFGSLHRPRRGTGQEPDRASPSRVTLAVGPEGGWQEDELAMFRSHGFMPVGLGPRPLRTDTAVIALIAQINASW